MSVFLPDPFSGTRLHGAGQGTARGFDGPMPLNMLGLTGRDGQANAWPKA